MESFDSVEFLVEIFFINFAFMLSLITLTFGFISKGFELLF